MPLSTSSRITTALFAAGLAMSAAAGPPENLPAADGDPRPAVIASNTFGLELFRALGRDEPGRNVFISPYSMSVALTMAAEGARTQTEAEMAKVLGFPSVTEGRSIAPVHAGYAALTRRFAQAAGTADPKVRERIKKLRSQLQEANETAESLSNKQKWTESQQWSEKAEKVADELNALLPTVDRFDLRIANALWVEKTFSLVPSYVSTIDRWYGTGGVTPVDFLRNPDKCRRIINTWVEDHTEKRIKGILPQGSIGSDTRFVLANAVYFKGQWADPFEESRTKEEDFTLEGGKKIRVKMMQDHWRGATGYAAFSADGSFFETPHQVPRDEAKRPKVYPDGGFTMIELPYRGNELSMVVIAPREIDGLGVIESNLSAAALSDWFARLEKRTVDTAMPRFKMDYEHEMSRTLAAMGMQRAFISPGVPGGGSADFSGMSAGTDPAEQLYIGIVQHKAWVEVTEKGTEAAAATVIAMPTAAAARPEEMVPFNPVFRADRPFLFLIRDMKTGVVLFMGRMMNPATAN